MRAFTHETGGHLEIDGAKIYYELAGDPDAAPLLFLHGGIGTIEDFNALIRGITRSYRIIGIDSRGHGKSTLGPQPLSYARLQRDAESVLAHLGINKLGIIGFSDGGIVAYRLAAAKRLHIERLVAIGAHWRLANDDPVRAIYRKVTGDSWRRKFPDTYELYRRLNPAPDFDRLVANATTMWQDSSAEGSPGETSKTISCPLLMIRGDDDHLVSLSSLVELRNTLKGAKLLNVASAGHVAFDDQRDICLLALIQFLAA
jgi:pimeloyl-ACP methyl ester carboxylesterase